LYLACITTYFVYNEPVIILMLDEVLKEKGKTAYQVAKSAGLHQSVVSKFRRNEAKMIALDVLDRLCGELDCKPSDLIVHQSSKPHNTTQTVKPQSVLRDTEKPASNPETQNTMASTKGMTTEQVAKRLAPIVGKILSNRRILDYVKLGKLKSEQGGNRTARFFSEADYLEFETWYRQSKKL
jgi:DNA-binding Xre family transcriptional regulator